jgi:hypothetical protein
LASAALPSAGIYCLAHPDSASQLIVHTGSQAGHSGGHGHADALSICLQSQGHALLIDPGTFEYVGEGPERNRFRGTAMHNTLRVDGADQSEPAGPFAWKEFAPAKAEQWIEGESFDLFVGSHHCYSNSLSMVVHRRTILSLKKSGLLLVRDFACGAGEHRLDLAWHLGPEMRMRAEHLFEVKGASGGLALLCAEKHGWAEEVRKDVWSPVYGEKESITVLNFGADLALPAEFVTLLVPLMEIHGIPGELRRLTEPAAMPVEAYSYGTPMEECSFFFSSTSGSWIYENLASDAEFLCWQRALENENHLFILCNGSYIEIDGIRTLVCKRRVTRCEIIIRDGQKEIHASDLDALME